ncbi:hypothetical protein [Aedoeadaptatus acetigenes]|uniref:hypothetical protein n=1 Tax=Aedoeadaptatus acetigenes TaxID=2981723 RepID=UPI0011DD6202|nr:hypothetical protein [Aedoeadaptatus acetigenes]MCU6786858.1 hypothetical protein [Aedoeadaptatus acetigenes]
MTRTKGLTVLGALFLVGLAAILIISDATPRTIKAMNLAFSTHVTGRAVCVDDVKKPPDFLGDGVSYTIYKLDDEDMAQLKKDLKKTRAFSADSAIGRKVDSALKWAKQVQPEINDPALSFPNCRYYFVDRSPSGAGDSISNYDALVVDEENLLILYLVYDT